MTTDSQRDAAKKASAKIADKYIPRDGLASAAKAPQRAKSRSKAPKTPKPEKHVSKPLYSSGEGTTSKELFPPKPLIRAVGRPSKYTLEIAAEICERISMGEKVADICLDDHMPAPRSVYLWLSLYDEFSQSYAKAQTDRTHSMAEELLEISDDARNDWMEKHGEDDAGWQVNGEHIARSRLRIDTRKWLMMKLAPAKYGETKTITGPGGQPLFPAPAKIVPRDLPVEIREMMREACRAVLEERDEQIIDVTPEESEDAQDQPE